MPQSPNRPLIFDGHNDALFKQYLAGPAARSAFLTGNDCHIDRIKAQKGGLAGGFFAIYVPVQDFEEGDGYGMSGGSYDVPLPPPVPQDVALEITMAQARILKELEAEGALRICTGVAEITTCLAQGTMAAIMHLEGAEAIDTDLKALDTLHDMGLRSIGPVWSRPTAFGHGVPFRFPSSPDTGPGLTGPGKELVRRCNELGIMIDLSHMNEAGFRDVARLSDAPLVATHSNAHAICPHARNLTDEQLAMIRDSDGMVGLNYACAFLRPDGQMRDDTGFDMMLAHLDHLLEKLGENRVGLGSDFDGAMIPRAMADSAGLVAWRAAMRGHGYGAELIEKICMGNWLALLSRTWKPEATAQA